MASRFASEVNGSNVEAIEKIADELHAVTGVAAATSNATTTAVTMTAAQALAGVYVNTANGALALTLPTAANIIAALPNAQTGSTFVLYVVNKGDNTVTLTTNTGLTITGGHGTATLATATSQILIFKVTSSTAVTVYPFLKTAS